MVAAFMGSAEAAGAEPMGSPDARYAGGFADLAATLGDDRVGLPITPEIAGDEPESVVQVTTLGAFYWSPEHAPTFLDPATQHRFALLPSGVRDWIGESLDPPALAEVGAIPHRATFLAIAECESHGNWSINSGNGFFGGTQTAPSTWKAYGGLQYAPRADLATPSQQMIVDEAILAGQGWRAWPFCSKRLGLR
jgi:hypothetical protein